jgi:hypothetical protein
MDSEAMAVHGHLEALEGRGGARVEGGVDGVQTWRQRRESTLVRAAARVDPMRRRMENRMSSGRLLMRSPAPPWPPPSSI